MKKHIANIITGSRIVLSLPLRFIPLTSAWFYVLYLLCGLSDMIDGTVARRTNSASELGAKLDTVSDFVFLSVALIKFVPHLHIQVWLWKDVCLYSATPVSASDIRPLRCSIRPWKCKRARKTLPAGRHRSFSMKWIIVMES